jgi:hypothetical protein
VKGAIRAGLPLADFVRRFALFCSGLEFERKYAREFGEKVNDASVYTFVSARFTSEITATIRLLGKNSRDLRPLAHWPVHFGGAFPKVDQLYTGDKPIFERSILKPNVEFELVLPFHLLAFQAAEWDWDAAEQILGNAGRIHQLWGLFPLRYVFAVHLAQFRFFIRNADPVLSCFEHALDEGRHRQHFCLLFALAQRLFLRTPEKPAFLKMMAGVSGLFYTGDAMPDGGRRAILATFLHILCFFLYDRLLLEHRTKSIRQICVMSYLLSGPMTLGDIDMV